MLESPTIVKSGNQYLASYGSDANLYIRFYDDAVKNEFRSNDEGIDRFDQFAFIEVITPGNKNKHIEKVAVLQEDGSGWLAMPHDSAQPSWIQRFPTQWEQFKAKQTQVVEGFPVTECPFFTKSQALNLKSNNIHTLEQIAAMTDQDMGVLGLGARVTRDKVIAFLDNKKGSADIAKLYAKLERLEADNLVMKEQLAEKGSAESAPPSARAKKLNIS